MTSFGEGSLPRHAGVLPSFAAHLVRRRIRYSAGEISGDDLLAWSGTLPSERRGAEIRTIFVDGRRNRFAEIWNLPVGVRLSDGWEQAVAPTDRERIRALVAILQTPAEFAALTLRDVKTALSRSVGDVLGVLARLEALYWTPAANQLRQAGKMDEQAQATREVTDEWRTRVRIAASSSWVALARSHLPVQVDAFDATLKGRIGNYRFLGRDEAVLLGELEFAFEVFMGVSERPALCGEVRALEDLPDQLFYSLLNASWERRRRCPSTNASGFIPLFWYLRAQSITVVADGRLASPAELDTISIIRSTFLRCPRRTR